MPSYVEVDHNFDTTQGLVVAAERGRITAKISTMAS